MKLLIALLLAASMSANAETVDVKYRGPVNLDGFQCKATVSSFVHRICYKSESMYVVVLLQNTYYHYCGVDRSTVNQWLSAQSLGRFYNANIKGGYDCRLGGMPSN